MVRFTFRLPAVALTVALATACAGQLTPDFDPPYICRTSSPVTESVYLLGNHDWNQAKKDGLERAHAGCLLRRQRGKGPERSSPSENDFVPNEKERD